MVDTTTLSRKYKAPKAASKEFRSYWNTFIVTIASRDNFAKHHMKNLEILCNMYVEYDRMTEIIKEEGFSYISEGRNGIQKKLNPEYIERNKLLAEIRQFSRLLDIVPTKDQAMPSDSEDDGEWS